jgi:hypothetical protein
MRQHRRPQNRLHEPVSAVPDWRRTAQQPLLGTYPYILTTGGLLETDVFSWYSNDVARGGGSILDHCVVQGSDRVEGSDDAYGGGNELVRLRRA